MTTTKFDFSGHTFVVTGAAQGIGAAMTRYFLDAGARVAAFDRQPEALAAAWGNESGDQVLALAVDLSTDPAIPARIRCGAMSRRR